MNNLFISTHLRSSFGRWFSRVDRRAPLVGVGIKAIDGGRLSTPASVRQGEWVFVPAPEARTPLVIHWCAPLVQPGGGTPHIVAELARGQGEIDWYHPQHAPQAITNTQFQRLAEPLQRAPGWSERLRVTDSVTLFARGAVRHPDYSTIHLDHWHRVSLADSAPD